MKTLDRVVKDRVRDFDYRDLTVKLPCGMTKAQRYFRGFNIKEVVGDPTNEQRESHVVVDHPATWTVLPQFGDKKAYLLVPKELAIKVELTGCLPERIEKK